MEIESTSSLHNRLVFQRRSVTTASVLPHRHHDRSCCIPITSPRITTVAFVSRCQHGRHQRPRFPRRTNLGAHTPVSTVAADGNKSATVGSDSQILCQSSPPKSLGSSGRAPAQIPRNEEEVLQTKVSTVAAPAVDHQVEQRLIGGGVSNSSGGDGGSSNNNENNSVADGKEDRIRAIHWHGRGICHGQYDRGPNGAHATSGNGHALKDGVEVDYSSPSHAFYERQLYLQGRAANSKAALQILGKMRARGRGYLPTLRGYNSCLLVRYVSCKSKLLQIGTRST
ncbi:unnamed protein product [Sphacelaria rigidula]